MDTHDSSSSQAPRQIIDGNETSSPNSAGSRKRDRRKALSRTKEAEVCRLYRARAGSAREIAQTYGIAQSTVFDILRRGGVPLRYPKVSAAASEAARKRWNGEVAPNPPEQISWPPAADPAPPEPAPAQAAPSVPRRRARRKRSWWRRLMKRLFNR